MAKFKSRTFLFSVLISLFLPFTVFAANPPASQTAGGIAQQEKMLEKGKKLEKEIKQKPKKEKGVVTKKGAVEEEGEKVLIKTIKVEGVSLIPEKNIKEITSRYEGKKLSLKGMQKIADLITDEYRKKGYVTSRAYIPPQTVQKGILIIRVIEGNVGMLEIRGNRYFKTSLLKKKIRLKTGKPFDYSELQKDLTVINEAPDRTARLTLVPGKEPGTTDIIMDVQDNFPFHLGFEYDNYGSRYIEKDRVSAIVEHNNLLGFDDKLYLKLQRSEYDLYRLITARYVVPLNNTTKVGAYFSHSKTKLDGEFEVVDSRGKATIIGLFMNKGLIDTENADLRLNLGFDYKNVKNYLLGSLNSEDRLRIFKTGFDLDLNDKFGRTVISPELDVGVPHILGGMDSKDNNASREGAGGKFLKETVTLFRLQPAPFSSYILWKNQAQYSTYNLTASEQFQIGGPMSVRGYPVAEFSGDKGYYTSLEWSFPPYFIPKKLRVPFTQDTIYKASHVVLFYDWATVHLNKVLSGDKKRRTLKSAGFGFRLNLSNDFSARIEFGYPLGKHSSDGHNLQRWIEVVHTF